VVIKVLYVVLVLSIATLVAVAIAVVFRVRRHLGGNASDAETPTRTEAPVQDKDAAPPEEI